MSASGIDDPTGPRDRHRVLSQALVELKAAKRRIDQLERGRSEPVAVVGVGCRFPGGADGVERFWAGLSEGRSAIGEVPPDRWDMDAFFDPDPDAPGKIATRHAGLLEGVDRFDAPLFGISPREVAVMDPQQRIVLEVAWEALEHASIAPDGVRGVAGGVPGDDFDRVCPGGDEDGGTVGP